VRGHNGIVEPRQEKLVGSTQPDIEKIIVEDGIKRVKVGGFDLDGVLRGKYISTEKFLSALTDGLGFCDVIVGWDCADSLYDKGQFTGWHTGFPDLIGKIDPSTFRLVPWETYTAFALVDFHTRDGEPLPFCPRQSLKRVVAHADSLDFIPKMAAEYEWFLFEETSETAASKDYRNLKPESPGMFCYSLQRASAQAELIRDWMDSLHGFGIEVEGLHTETGPGAFEACVKYGDALQAADKAGLFKGIIKEVAARHGYIATFMAKWNAAMPGCGGHIHQSLASSETGENLFAVTHPQQPSTVPQHPTPNTEYPCSLLALNYIAGQQQLLPDMMPLICPTINSYKRLVPGFWAPTTATWGIENRTNALRLIPGASPKATRIETRIVGADANPYLAMAACLASGIHGIENNLNPTEPTVGNAYGNTNMPELPRSLAAATERMRNSDTARQVFGNEFVEHVCMTREWECKEFEKEVTDWELRRYFEII
jgi:glutamine synthetase